MKEHNFSKNIRLFINDFDKKIFFVTDLYNEFTRVENKITEGTFLKCISRMCANGELEKLGKGIYGKIYKTRFGNVGVSEQDIIDFFVDEGTSGVLIGYDVFKEKRLTTQIAKKHKVYSNKLKGKRLLVKNVEVTYFDYDFKSNSELVQYFDLINELDNIEDINVHYLEEAFYNFSNKYDEKQFDILINLLNVKKSVIATISKILNYFNVSNNLKEKYLSSFSNYKMPEVIKQYEIALK